MRTIHPDLHRRTITILGTLSRGPSTGTVLVVRLARYIWPLS